MRGGCETVASAPGGTAEQVRGVCGTQLPYRGVSHAEGCAPASCAAAAGRPSRGRSWAAPRGPARARCRPAQGTAGAGPPRESRPSCVRAPRRPPRRGARPPWLQRGVGCRREAPGAQPRAGGRCRWSPAQSPPRACCSLGPSRARGRRRRRRSRLSQRRGWPPAPAGRLSAPAGRACGGGGRSRQGGVCLSFSGATASRAGEGSCSGRRGGRQAGRGMVKRQADRGTISAGPAGQARPWSGRAAVAVWSAPHPHACLGSGGAAPSEASLL